MVESIKELKKICYEGHNVNRPAYMKHVGMKISIYITKLCIYLGLNANHVTITMLFLTIFGSFLMFFGNLWLMLIGILLIHFTIILDCVNGEVARYRKECNIVGMHMEDIYHQLTAYLVFFSLAYGVFVQTGFKSVLIFGFLGSIFSKSIVFPSLYSALVKNMIHKNTPMDYLKEQHKQKHQKEDKSSSELGGFSRKIHKIYNAFSGFWAHPSDIVQVNIIIILELLNQVYNIIPSYSLVYWYLVVYGSVSTLKQITSFIIHIKGKTIEDYYKKISKQD